MIIIILVILIYAKLKNKTNLFKITLLALLALLFSDLITLIVKIYVNKPRPYTVLNNVRLLVSPDDFSSFPSGHSTSTLSVITIFIIHIKKLTEKYNKVIHVFLIIFVMMIVFSRVYIGVHYPFDVLTGAIIGFTGALFINKLNEVTGFIKIWGVDMSSIVGIKGKFKSDNIIQMLKVTKHRGPDSSGIYLDKLYEDINLDNFKNDNKFNIALASNLSKVYDLNDRISKSICHDNLVLVFDGVLYNFHTIKNLLTKVGVKKEVTSDCEALLYLIDFYNNGDLVKAIKSAVKVIDGDYSFAVFDGDNLALVRDRLGVKPLFYGSNNELFAFASTKQALLEVGVSDINTLKPEHILFNGEDILPTQQIHETIVDGQVNKIDKLLKLSVTKRVQDISEVGVIFSGGVDSSYLALLLKEISQNIPLKITLYAVGIEGSKDIDSAIYASKFLNLELKTQILTEDLIRKALPSVVKAIGDVNLMKVGVGLTTYFATKMVAEDNIKVAISGQGADELFGGYKRYLDSFINGTLNYDIRHDVANMYHVNLQRDDACSMLNSVELRLPFLDEKFVELVLNIPDNKKIVSMHDDMRKSFLRKLAFEEGLDYDIAYRPKKAAQYGTGIDKILRKKILKDTDISKFL